MSFADIYMDVFGSLTADAVESIRRKEAAGWTEEEFERWLHAQLPAELPPDFVALLASGLFTVWVNKQ